MNAESGQDPLFGLELPKNRPQHDKRPGGFGGHPGDDIPDYVTYMGVVMPKEDADFYANGGERPNDTLPTKEKAPTRLEKLAVIYDLYGFFPHTGEELTKAWGLYQYEGRLGWSALYLNHVLRHQQEDSVNAPDPQAAVRSVVKSWKEFFQDARVSTVHVDEFGDVASQYPEKTTSELCKEYTDLAGGQWHRAVEALAVVSGIAEMTGQQRAGLEDPTKELFTKEDAILRLKTLSRSALKERVWQIHLSEKRRVEFWKAALQQAMAHQVARPIVQKLFGKLDGETDVLS